MIELRLAVPPGTTTSPPVLQYRERLPMYATGPYCPGDWGAVADCAGGCR